MRSLNEITAGIVDDDDSVRWVLEKALEKSGAQVKSFSSANSALDAFLLEKPDVVITDIRMPGMDGIEFVREVSTKGWNIPIIVITAHSDLDNAVSAYQAGAFEYLPKPFDVDEAVDLVKRAVNERNSGFSDSNFPSSVSGIFGHAPAMQTVFRSIGRLSSSSMTVLITGESGTGKELVARALHKNSPRAEKPFIALNTTAIAAELLESELFGHERGAFTGAERRRIGRFEQANLGTLFLDEIGDMSLDLQKTLLRVLDEGEFFRLGGNEPIKVDVRIIAATNKNLEVAIANGQFRDDLFHRLNVVRINTPPLRERREDIPLLMDHYLKKASDELGNATCTLTDEALFLLQSFNWPGNVRQLVNAARSLSVIAPGNEICVGDIPADLGGNSTEETASSGAWIEPLASWASLELQRSQSDPLLPKALPIFEAAIIQAALDHALGRKQDAAKLLGWGRNTLARKMKELGLKN
ncbi:MAG: nitrogen regulation protein NR(I) [Pseudomonadota bacterium]|nr:nitrogen regulation protein NR(I) [Pseudomonadota bacterium]